MSRHLRWNFLCLVALLALSACSGIPPVAAPVQIQPQATEQPLADEPDPTPTAGASSTANSSQVTPEKGLTATPVTSKVLAHPQGCSPASLTQGVLLYTWSDRNRENSLFPVDAVTGQPLCAFEPISLGYQFVHAFSPDGNIVAFMTSERESGRFSELQWIDLKTWQLNKTPIQFENYAIAVAFSPDGQKLAITAAGDRQGQSSNSIDYKIVLVDLASWTVQAEATLDFLPRLLKFNTDGSTVVVYGSPGDPSGVAGGEARLTLFDSASLATLWETTLSGVFDGQLPTQDPEDDPEGFEFWEPAVVFAPDQNALYIIHADTDRMTTVDLNNRTTQSVDLLPATSWLERLLALTAGVAHAKTLDGYFKSAVLSLDGSRLYILSRIADSYLDVAGNWQFGETPQGLKVIEVTTGAEVAHIDTQATELEFSEDGKSLLLRSWMDNGWTEVIDTDTLDRVALVKDRQISNGRRLDGQPVLLSTTYHQNGQTTLAIVDPASFDDVYKGWTTLWASWLLHR